MTDATLKPCPFCGSDDVELDEDEVAYEQVYVRVACEDCFAKGPNAFLGCRDDDEDGPIDLDAEARKFWNTRAEPSRG